MRFTTLGQVIAVALITMTGLPGVADPIIPAPHTTVYVEPVREDGTIDYVAIINERGAQIDPADNAAVVLAGLMDDGWPDEWPDEKCRIRTLEMLGWPEADPKLHIHDPDWRPNLDDFDGWSLEPEAIEWLRANKLVLDAVRDAPTVRTEMFWPLMDTDHEREFLIWSLLPHLREIRRWSRLLIGRANLRKSNGDLQGAWQDLRGVLAWGNRLGEGQIPLVSAWLAQILHSMAWVELHVLITELPEASLHGIRAELENWPALPGFSSVLELERMMFLDTWQQFVAGHLSYADVFNVRDVGMTQWNEPRNLLDRPGFDPNRGMIAFNTQMNRLQAISRIDSLRARRQAIKTFERDLENIQITGFGVDAVRGLLAMEANLVLPGTDRIMAEFGMGLMLSSYQHTFRMRDNLDGNFLVLRLACAQQLFKLQHGHYASTWDAIIESGLIDATPIDPFDGEPVRILVTEDGQGCAIYLVGTDFHDDGGRSFMEAEYDPNDPDDEADLVIRLGDIAPPEYRK